MSISRFLLSLFSFFIISACGPIYETSYELRPPLSSEGRFCTNQCAQNQQFCRQNCNSQVQMCEYNERLRAQNEYYAYAEEQRAKGQKIVKTPDSFYNSFQCSNVKNSCQDQCDDLYRSCFAGCGGKVIPHTTCVANCDQ